MICPYCQHQLRKDEGRFTCINNHHFDIARSGYVNLLLNQPHAGDNKMMINSRKVIHNQGYFRILLNELINILHDYQVKSMLDLGCGEGYYSRNIKKAFDIPVYGIDISKIAIDAAAKQAKDVLYIVGNIYHLPFADEEVDVIINIFAPYSREVKRVMQRYLIKVEPGPRHLIELKQAIFDDLIIRDEKEKIPDLEVFKAMHLSYQVYVAEIDDLLRMTPFYYRLKGDKGNISGMDVTMDFRITIYQK